MNIFPKKRIYLDYASATPVLLGAIRAMRNAEKLVGNSGAIHQEGVGAKKVLELARESIALELACKSREVIFTSGLTESNDLAIVGVARRLERLKDLKQTHWIVSAIEHDAVLESFAEVERMGGIVSHVQPNPKGIITVEAVEKLLRPETVMVSVGWANNEIGVVQPIRGISRNIRDWEGQTFPKMGRSDLPKILLHCDAGQAPLYMSPHVHTLGVDLLALGSNKLYGPHGIGALYLSNRVQTANILFGGKQERGLRPGTENVALAAGFAAAVTAIGKERNAEYVRIKKIRDDFAKRILESIHNVVINGDIARTLPHMLNVSVPNVDAEYVTLALSERGVSVSTKSACREGEESESHVVAAISADVWRAQNSFRFSLGRETRAKDIKNAAKLFAELVKTANNR